MHGILDERVRGFTDPDLAGVRGLLEPGGDVDRIAGHERIPV
jgi:hypothetical protein